MCFSVSFWDRVSPTVMGIPFNMIWMLAWIVLTSAAMSVAYLIEKRLMSKGTLALSIIFGIVGLGSAVGFFAGRRRQLNLEEWAVAGRGLGLVLVWILLAGETFTTFSVLGISGWINTKGGPTLYVLAYLSLGYVFIFFFGPSLWEVGRRYGLHDDSSGGARRRNW